MIDTEIGKVLFSAIVFVLLVVYIIWIGVSSLGSDEVRTKVPLKPKIEIMIVDGVADTTYIYKLKEEKF